MIVASGSSELIKIFCDFIASRDVDKDNNRRSTKCGFTNRNAFYIDFS